MNKSRYTLGSDRIRISRNALNRRSKMPMRSPFLVFFPFNDRVLIIAREQLAWNSSKNEREKVVVVSYTNRSFNTSGSAMKNASKACSFFCFFCLFRITLFRSCNYAVRCGEVRSVWERGSEPRGEPRVTLILLFVAGPIRVHPPPPPLAPSAVPSSHRNLGFLPSGGVASYISWLSKPS